MEQNHQIPLILTTLFRRYHVVLLFLILPTVLKSEVPFEAHQFTFGVIPVFSYDADLGFKYGAVMNFFDYAPKQTDYTQYLLLRLTSTTRNTLNIQSVLETEHLIPGTTTFIEAGYTNDQKLDFFGFNGGESIYRNNYEEEESPEFLTDNFYTLNRKLIRLRTDIQKHVGANWRTLTGITFNHFILQSNKGFTPTLYDKYYDWGIIV